MLERDTTYGQDMAEAQKVAPASHAPEWESWEPEVVGPEPDNEDSDSIRDYLRSTFGREPTARELSTALEWDMAAVDDLRRRRKHTVSLDAPVGDHEESDLDGFVEADPAWAPEALAIRQLTKEAVLQAFREIPPRMALVLELRFGLIDDRLRTLEEVGRELEVTRERARQIERQALAVMRESKELPALVGGPDTSPLDFDGPGEDTPINLPAPIGAADRVVRLAEAESASAA